MTSRRLIAATTVTATPYVAPHLAHWPARLPRRLEVPATSLWFNLEVSARRYPKKPVCIYLGRELSYGDLHRQAEALAGGQRAVGFDAAGEGGGVQPFLRHLGKGLLEHVERFLSHRAARRHGVAAELEDHARVALGHQVECVAQVKAGDGAA